MGEQSRQAHVMKSCADGLGMTRWTSDGGPDGNEASQKNGIMGGLKILIGSNLALIHDFDTMLLILENWEDSK
jgi:hypothetical protein